MKKNGTVVNGTEKKTVVVNPLKTAVSPQTSTPNNQSDIQKFLKMREEMKRLEKELENTMGKDEFKKAKKESGIKVHILSTQLTNFKDSLIPLFTETNLNMLDEEFEATKTDEKEDGAKSITLNTGLRYNVIIIKAKIKK